MTGLDLAIHYAAVLYAWRKHTKLLHEAIHSLKHYPDNSPLQYQAKRKASRANYKLRTLRPLKKLLEYHLSDDMEDGTITREDVKDKWPAWMNEYGRVKPVHERNKRGTFPKQTRSTH